MSAASYEIHVSRNGSWTIQAFFDDKELALLEARRISETNRYPAVRVVEEIVEPNLDDVKQRVVYRWSQVDKTAPDDQNASQDRASAGRRRRDDAATEARRPRRPAWLQPDSYAVIAAKGLGILVLGAALIYGINALGS
jgi:hypothetical protein